MARGSFATKRSTKITVDRTNERIGAAIRKHRKRAGMTQEELARSIDLSTFFIGAVERGQAAISLRSLVSVANVLKVSVGDLIDEPPADAEGLRTLAVQLLKMQVQDADLPTILNVVQRFARGA